jgi:homoprotocatechuate degradation regulator HpaR
VPALKLPRRNLALRLLEARETVMRRFRPLVAEEGLTEQQWRILRVLAERSPLEPGQIADACSILSPSLTGILARMESVDLVARAQSASDQRRQSVNLTAKSREIVERMIPRIEAEYRRLDADWGADTVEALHAMLDRVAALEAGRTHREAASVPTAGVERPAGRRRRSVP